MKPKLITGLIIVGILAIFFIQNAATVEIRMLFWTITMSRILLMLILMFIGIVAGWLLKHFSDHLRIKKH